MWKLVLLPWFAQAPEADAVIVARRGEHRPARMPVETLDVLCMRPLDLIQLAVVGVPEGDAGALAGRGEGLFVERMPRYDGLLPRAGLLDLRVGRVKLVDGLAQAPNVEELDLHVARAGQQVDAVDWVPARLQHC